MILARLKRATADAHARTERLLPTLGELSTRDGYIRCLTALHGFYVCWEPAVWASARDAVPELDIPERHRLGNLERDLSLLGAFEVLRCAPSADAPVFATVAEALGALYVLEGAALGGQAIVHSIERSAGETQLPIAFFSGSGVRTGELWRSFGDALRKWTSANGADDRVVQGAVNCFSALEQWLVSTGRETGFRAARIA